MLASKSFHRLYENCRGSGYQFSALRDVVIQSRLHGLVVGFNDLRRHVFCISSKDVLEPRFVLISVNLPRLMFPMLKAAL